MTVNTAVSSVVYPGDDSPGPFTFPFKVFTADDLYVYTTDAQGVTEVLTLDEDFTATGVGQASGSITLTDDLPDGEFLTIRRSPALLQLLSIRNQGAYFPATIEDRFDLAVMQMQALRDDMDDFLGDINYPVPVASIRQGEDGFSLINNAEDRTTFFMSDDGNLGLGTVTPTGHIHSVLNANGPAWIKNENESDDVLATAIFSAISDESFVNLGLTSSGYAGSPGPFTADTAFVTTDAPGGLNLVAQTGGPIEFYKGVTDEDIIGLLTGAISRFGRTAGSVNMEIFGAAGTNRGLFFDTVNEHRACWYIDDLTEGGANAGSNVWLSLFDDTGTPFLDIFFIKRNTGNTIMGGDWGGIPTDRGGVLQILGKTRTGTSGTTYGLQIWPVYNQTSGTASNIDFQINRTKTAVGSGAQKFIECSVQGTGVMFHVLDNGDVGAANIAGTTVTSTGNITRTGTGNVRVYVTNTTATTGRAWYLNSANAGSFIIGNDTAGDLFTFTATSLSVGSISFSTTGDVTGALSIAVTQTTSGVRSIVAAHSHASNPLGIRVQYTAAAPNGTGNHFIYCDDTGDLRFAARSNGGLENYSANNVNRSDRRLKTGIKALESQWDKHKLIEVVRGRYKDQDHSDDNFMGIAQNIQKVYPAFVDKNPKTGILSVYEHDLDWATRRVVQEAQDRIEELEKKVRKLTSARNN